VTSPNNRSIPLHVLIVGAGIVGLTIAQGCRRQGIPFTIFEGDESRESRPQGWAVTLHWCLDSLRRTIGPELSGKLLEVTIHVDN
jgi:glycine/D-amino acid oxidase-like deaminating enzyme